MSRLNNRAKPRQPRSAETPHESAKAAGLRYVNDSLPGVRRMRAGRGFRYVNDQGKPLRGESEIQRIKSLAIPPAWTDVWICPVDRGHLQATGRDARGRKQFLYHARWREVRDATKFDRLAAFGQALPRLRAQVEEHLSLPGLPREKVLAALVRLLETTFIRVGNEEYARHNGSVGLTTMQDRHLEVAGAELRFEFHGKGRIWHTITLRDRRLATIMKRCQELPGQDLFQYHDDGGQTRSIGSADVNQYLREITGQDFTAKDFRTWAGSCLAMAALSELPIVRSHAQAKRSVNQVIEQVAQRLGNTKTVCRKCYIHPAIIESHLDGTLVPTRGRVDRQRATQSPAGLSTEETSLLAFLEERISI
jgi:DNA topoisomerase-1